jgi:hypothetical protein
MTYIELQKTLREFRDNGTELSVKLNATKEALQAEYDRLTAAIVTEPEEELVIESFPGVVQEIEKETNDNYWSIWDNQYAKALTKMSSENKDTCDLKHEQIGLVLVAACYLLLELTFTELSKAYQLLKKTNNKRLFPIVRMVYQNAIK